MEHHEQDISQIEKLLRGSRENLALYRSQIHNPPISISLLPIEILENIFYWHWCDRTSFQDFFEITHVCYIWREVGRRMRLPWATIDLLYPEDKYQAWMKRAGNAPLIVQLAFRYRADMVPVSVAESRSQPLVQAHTLTINGNGHVPTSAYEFMDRLLTSYEFPNLRDLTIKTYPLHVVRRATLPESVVSLNLMRATFAYPKFTNLKRLHLTLISHTLSAWETMFLSLTSLKELRISRVGVWLTGPPILHEESSLAFPCLQVLQIKDIDQHLYDIFYRIECFPTLSELTVSSDGPITLHADELIRRMPNLTMVVLSSQIHFDGDFNWTREYLQCLRRCRLLRTLIVDVAYDVGDVEDFIAYLEVARHIPSDPKVLDLLYLVGWPEEKRQFIVDRVHKGEFDNIGGIMKRFEFE